jgi:hypothetical protein
MRSSHNFFLEGQRALFVWLHKYMCCVSACVCVCGLVCLAPQVSLLEGLFVWLHKSSFLCTDKQALFVWLHKSALEYMCVSVSVCVVCIHI